jgi:hypothetical protein
MHNWLLLTKRSAPWVSEYSSLFTSKQRWPIVTRAPNVLPTTFSSEHCFVSKLLTLLFYVWNWNEDRTMVQHFPTRVGACYVTHKRNQGSLKRDSTIYASMVLTKPVKTMYEVGVGFVSFLTSHRGWLLWESQYIFWFHKIRGIPWHVIVTFSGITLRYKPNK